MASVFPSALSGATNAQPPVANPRQVLSIRLAKLSLRVIADAIGKDETEACKVRSGERRCSVSEFASLLDAAGLKMVSKEKQCVPADELAMLRRVYARHNNVDLWEDPE